MERDVERSGREIHTIEKAYNARYGLIAHFYAADMTRSTFSPKSIVVTPCRLFNLECFNAMPGKARDQPSYITATDESATISRYERQIHIL
jgi:hypothetical protein